MSNDASDMMIVDDLLSDLMTALGKSHADLINSSKTELGTLVVKSAEITVNFDMSAEASSNFFGPTLRVRPTPFYGLVPSVGIEGEASQTRVSNHAQLTVQIVNVAPFPEPEKNEPDNDSSDSTKDEIKSLLEAIKIIQDSLLSKPPLATLKEADGMNEALHAAYSALRSKDEGRAKRFLVNVLPDLAEIIRIYRITISKEVGDSMATLMAWVQADKLPRRPMPAKKRRAITVLGQTISRLRLTPDAPQKMFEKAIAAAEDTDSERAAQVVLVLAVRDLRRHLSGVALPREMIEAMGDLNLLAELSDPDDAWRDRLEQPLAAIHALISSLDVPPSVKGQFTKNYKRVLVSQSEVEAASMLFFAVNDFRRRTNNIQLPDEVRSVLDSIGSEQSTHKK